MFNRKKNKNDKKDKKLTLLELETKEEKTRLNINKNKEKKIGPKTASFLNFIRILLWFSIILILAVGALQMIRSKQPKIVQNIVEYNMAVSEGETAKAFAVTFAKEFLTYRSENSEEYYRRIGPFMLSTIRSGVKTEYSKGSSIVKDVIAWDVEKINKEHSNIIVRAEIETVNEVDVIETMNIDGTITKEPKKKNKVVYLSVPIGYYNGGFIVEDYPTFVPDPEQPTDISFESFKGSEQVQDNVKQEIKEVLSNFLETYSSGNEGQISYYMENNKKIQGYNGKYIFDEIRTIEVYKTSENELKTLVQINMKDADINTLFTQRFIFTIVKQEKDKNKRWYIREFTNRGNIFSEGGQ